MPGIMLDIITAERVVFSDEVDIVVAPGVEGEMGILPHHTPLMTILEPGELRVRQEGKELCMAISGGFMEVRQDKVIVLADAAERDDEIDFARAEEARRRAQERIGQHATDTDLARAEASLRRALVRLKIVEKRRRRRGEM